jgi:hypothetical protein
MVRILRSRLCSALAFCGLILLLQNLMVGAVFAAASSRTHSIAFGKWNTVWWSPGTGSEDEKPIPLKVRALLVDARVKEFTLGVAHDVTERLFVVRRVFRVNDNLPQESASPPHWQWQRGGWLLVDRVTGHISTVNLPEFDGFYSGISWYRDYAAYCGVSDDGKKVYAVVAQIGRRKPVLKKLLDGVSVADGETKSSVADSACPVPAWQRSPARVSFEAAGAPRQTFAIRGHAVDLVNESEEQEDEEASK